MTSKVWAAFFLLLSSAGVLNAQPISFLPPVEINGIGGLRYPLPANSLVPADFNRDGKLDILAVNQPQVGFGVTAFTVSIGNGDGTFQSPLTLLSTDIVSSPVVADFNRDGNPDIAALVSVLSNGLMIGNVYVFLSNGDGTFGKPVVTPYAFRNGVLITADFNLDGKPDLINGQTVLIGNGDGTFQSLPATLDNPAVLTADFNHDGRPDVLLQLSSGQLAVALGAGNGTFGKDILVASPFVPGSFVAGDFNGDGYVDLAVSPSKSACGLNCVDPVASIAMLRGNGDGTFQPPVITANSTGPILAAADMNHDGKLDLIVGNSVMAGTGDGTFRFPVFFGLTTQACMIKPGPGCSVFTSAAITGDFNGDGLIDVAESVDRWDFIDQFTEANVAMLINDSPGDGFLVTGVSSASYKWPTGATSMVTAFGTNLASATATAPSAATPPTTLGGIRVHILDRSRQDSSFNPITTDELAPLFYVSPTQINFEISTTDTFMYISIEHVGSPYVPKGMVIPVQPLAPDFYTLNSAGLAAATAVQFPATGSPIAVPVTSCGTSTCFAVPVNVSSGAVYVSLYGTGFNSGFSLANAICSVGGINLQPTYAGPQLQIPGFDQMNLLLPSSLAGTGDATIQCSFGASSQTVSANPVHIIIQ